MNYVLKVPNLDQYTIYGVRRVDNGFLVRSITVEPSRVLAAVDIATHPTLEQANEAALKVATMKAELKGRVLVGDPPAYVRKHFEREDIAWVSNQQMVNLLAASKRERYVVFRDIEHLEGRFDLGVQYLATDLCQDDTLDVVDNFGEVCSCFKTRFESVELTETGKEVEAIELRRQQWAAKKQERVKQRN